MKEYFDHSKTIFKMKFQVKIYGINKKVWKKDQFWANLYEKL